MRSNSIPKGMLAIYEKIVGLTDDICDGQLNSEYRDLARNDRGVVQEAPKPAHFWTTSNVGGWDRLRSGKAKFSRRPFVSSVHDNGRSVRRIRSQREHRPRQSTRHREDP